MNRAASHRDVSDTQTSPSNMHTVIKANLKGRKELLSMVRSSGKRLTHMQPEASFRESFRIVGETMITVDDYTSSRTFDDALCHAFYPVDMHTRTGVQPKALTWGVVPTIPRGALIPKGSENIVVAGRSVSSDRLANSGLRVQASCMSMGQAAGAMAALAARNAQTPGDVPMDDIRATLDEQGAIVPSIKPLRINYDVSNRSISR